jgi:uncharacterized protein (TIGR04255 family)
MSTSIVTINPDETFEYLPKAPIVEAVIDLRARAEADWREELITNPLTVKLPDYPQKHSLSGFQQEFTLTPGSLPNAKATETGWQGLRFQTGDKLHVAQFNREGFSFSRLQPYDRWEQLVAEAMRLWDMFVVVAKPTEIQRVGLRYINSIKVPSSGFLLEDYVNPAPQGPKGLPLPFQHFFHQDLFGVPGYPYAVRLIRTIQPEPGPNPPSMGLILDIDVHTTQSFAYDLASVKRHLVEMRWLKNKIFFGNLTSKAVEGFR